MVIDDFDSVTKPIVDIESFYGKSKKVVEKCMIIFSKEIYDFLLNENECTQIGSCNACNGEIPIYSFEHKGERIAFYLTGIGSAMASGTCYEVHWQTGATKFVMFGSCGSLDREKTKGRYVVPTEAYRGDGASYYYAPPSDYIIIKKADRLAEIFEELGVPYVKGRVWTTDSMLRETVGLVNKRKDEGCIAVEMEVAGVEALCDFYGLELFDFLEAGDVLEESGYEIKDLNVANHSLAKLDIALRVIEKLGS
ncbi:MAG: nucleoside phosphorylase [Lachnospiraceae bacterium]|nr:nucleoside phosphorylase [Lachnospiraceae bacterium]